MSRRRRPRPDLSLLLTLLLAACGQGDASAPSVQEQGKETIGLYSSLPIAWNESADIKGLLADTGPAHWALDALRDQGRVISLDALADATGALPLPQGAVLVLAQPRPLTPQENAALDAWVQRGGRVLLFVDPMLTAHSLFPIGDPRRPQDIAMLSPILTRWGLLLEFDDAQPAGERLQGAVPVNLPGRFSASGKSGTGVGKAGDVVARCQIEEGGLVADCVAGKGRIVAVADAAVLENPEDSTEIVPRKAALVDLLRKLGVSARSGA
ncbi:DUF4350 domain-containing protein [Novosphingobium kaempferiae]|uniref:DUF4350 domain-containing protein n=1 Tax=Novosphingobium kaempferiae TaxID=2896849 RepID=UPI001E38B97A|nr:GldG family protein [Novosphingobium kaempferiae]